MPRLLRRESHWPAQAGRRNRPGASRVERHHARDRASVSSRLCSRHFRAHGAAARSSDWSDPNRTLDITGRGRFRSSDCVCQHCKPPTGAGHRSIQRNGAAYRTRGRQMAAGRPVTYGEPSAVGDRRRGRSVLGLARNVGSGEHGSQGTAPLRRDPHGRDGPAVRCWHQPGYRAHVRHASSLARLTTSGRHCPARRFAQSAGDRGSGPGVRARGGNRFARRRAFCG